MRRPNGKSPFFSVCVCVGMEDLCTVYVCDAAHIEYREAQDEWRWGADVEYLCSPKYVNNQSPYLEIR